MKLRKPAQDHTKWTTQKFFCISFLTIFLIKEKDAKEKDTNQGGRKQIFYGGAIVNSEKWIFKNSQNLLNKSPKHGGQVLSLPPQLRPPW